MSITNRELKWIIAGVLLPVIAYLFVSVFATKADAQRIASYEITEHAASKISVAAMQGDIKSISAQLARIEERQKDNKRLLEYLIGVSDTLSMDTTNNAEL